jgi:hypothetical protein
VTLYQRFQEGVLLDHRHAQLRDGLQGVHLEQQLRITNQGNALLNVLRQGEVTLHVHEDEPVEQQKKHRKQQ